MNKTYKPGMAGAATGVRFFSKYEPKVHAGETFTIKVEHRAGDAIEAVDGQAVHFIAEGPHERLAETDIVGRYPAPGTDTTPDEFLPHIALSRRALPWERRGVGGQAPWLALLLFKRSELVGPIASTKVAALKADHAAFHQKLKSLGYREDTQLDLAWVKKSRLEQVLPLPEELPLLCHAQSLELPPEQDPDDDLDPMWKLDDDACVAIVMSNRLPDASGAGVPEEHVACLVSIEGRDDLPWPTAADRKPYVMPSAQSQPMIRMKKPGMGVEVIDVDIGGVGVPLLPPIPLVVLHSWRFTPSGLGDFEQVMKAIRYTPNGGVLRFGKLPRAAGAITSMTDDGFLTLANPTEPTGKAAYRGPLAPIRLARKTTIAVRAVPEEHDDPAHPEKLDDYSYAAAFELGRLRALADDGLLSDLQGVRRGIVMPTIEEALAVDPRPKAIAKKDWVINPDPTVANPNENVILPPGKADFVGIADLRAEVAIPQLVADLRAVQHGVIVDQQIDIDNIPIGELDARFSQVLTHTRSVKE